MFVIGRLRLGWPEEHAVRTLKKRIAKVALSASGQRNGTHISDRVLVEVKSCDSAIGLVICGACHAQITQNDMLDPTYTAHLIQR